MTIIHFPSHDKADIKGLDNLTNLLKLKKWKRKMLSTNLKRIRINGYKSIEKLDLQMSSINILIGANGAGKSNFISLFTFLQIYQRVNFKVM